MFQHVVLALVHGSSYERLSRPEWADQGNSEGVHALALQAYDRLIGLELSAISVDGCITKAPCGGERADRSPEPTAKSRA